MGDAEGLGLSLGLAQHSNIAGGAGDREGKELSAGSQSQQQPRMQVDEMEGKETGKDGAVAWSAQATAALLDVYAERWSAMNCRNFRGEEWEELARNVNNRCSFIACKDVKNGKQCSYKMSNLKRKYKNEKELLRLRGGVSEWKWFCRMEQIFSSHPKYLWYVVYAGEGAERLDKDAADNTFEDPNSCSLSASKSASTTNTDGGFLPQCEMPMDSSPRSNTCRLRGAVVGKPSRKKHAISTRVDDFAVGISESMKMIAKQQREMIALMREMMASQDKQLYFIAHETGCWTAGLLLSMVHTYQLPSSDLVAAFQEIHVSGITTTREAAKIRKKIESIEQDLVPLKQNCTNKEMELRSAMEAYEEKSKLKSDLVKRLTETVAENERLKTKKLIELHRHTESMTRHPTTAQYVP